MTSVTSSITSICVFIALAQIANSTPYVSGVGHIRALVAGPYALQLVREKENIKCSGTVISPDGYVLTALHCVMTCNILAASPAPLKLPSGKSYLGTGYIPDPNGSCKFKDIGDALVVAWGTTRFIDSNDILKLAFENLADAAFLKEIGFTAPAGKGDFAILKLNNKNNLACAKVDRRLPRVGEQVWSFSYPKIEREDLKSKHGEPFYTEGVVNGSVLESSRLKDLPFNHPGLKVYPAFYDEPETFWSTLDAEGGSSGSAIFNEENAILGIFVSSLKPQQHYAEGTTKSISITHIMQSLEARLGSKKAKEIFNCI